jgi:branched-chain amino acid transport system substrate-binding protein
MHSLASPSRSAYSAAYNPRLIQRLGAAAEGVIATSLAPAPTTPIQQVYAARDREVGREPNGRPTRSISVTRPYRRCCPQVARRQEDADHGENFRK